MAKRKYIQFHRTLQPQLLTPTPLNHIGKHGSENTVTTHRHVGFCLPCILKPYSSISCIIAQFSTTDSAESILMPNEANKRQPQKPLTNIFNNKSYSVGILARSGRTLWAQGAIFKVIKLLLLDASSGGGGYIFFMALAEAKISSNLCFLRLCVQMKKVQEQHKRQEAEVAKMEKLLRLLRGPDLSHTNIVE